MVFDRQGCSTLQARSLHLVSRMRYTAHALLVALLTMALTPGAAFAARARRHAYGHRALSVHHGVVVHRDGHRRIVQNRPRNNALPPGLAKRRSLPPGLAKQVRERGQLPAGLQKRR